MPRKYYQGHKTLNTIKEFVDWGVIIEKGSKPPVWPYYYLLASIVLFVGVLIFT